MGRREEPDIPLPKPLENEREPPEKRGEAERLKEK